MENPSNDENSWEDEEQAEKSLEEARRNYADALRRVEILKEIASTRDAEIARFASLGFSEEVADQLIMVSRERLTPFYDHELGLRARSRLDQLHATFVAERRDPTPEEGAEIYELMDM